MPKQNKRVVVLRPATRSGAGRLIPTQTVEQYEDALKSLLPLPPSYVAMLQFDRQQPTKMTSSEAMARAVGFKNYGAVNRHYGKLAGLIGEGVGWKRKPNKVKLGVLVTFERRRGRWYWTLRDQVADALDRLG